MRAEMGSTGVEADAHVRRRVPFALAALSERAIDEACVQGSHPRHASINRRLDGAAKDTNVWMWMRARACAVPHNRSSGEDLEMRGETEIVPDSQWQTACESVFLSTSLPASVPPISSTPGHAYQCYILYTCTGAGVASLLNHHSPPTIAHTKLRTSPSNLSPPNLPLTFPPSQAFPPPHTDPSGCTHQARLGSRPTLSRVAINLTALVYTSLQPPAMPLSALSRPSATACRCSQATLLSLAGGARAHLVTRSNPAFLGGNTRWLAWQPCSILSTRLRRPGRLHSLC